jgi:poly(glycerol-phosphate) alpha-glucosyltransferase
MLAASLSRAGGGVYGAILGQSRALVDLGVPVSFVGLADGNSDADRPRDVAIDVTAVPRMGRGPFALAPGLGRALDRTDADLVHLHGLWMQPSLSLAGWRRRTGKPTVISAHGMLDPWALRNSAWKKRLAAAVFERANLSAASCLHALNEAEADAIRAFGLTNPVAVIPNGVDLPTPEEHRPPPAGRRVLLYLGRLHPKKGLGETIRAWSLLRRIAPQVFDDWRLVAAGWDDGGHEAEFRALAAEHGLEGDIEFPGPLYGEAKERALREADAFILASHSEGLPMAVLEAWAYSVPVFMSEGCNLPEGFAAEAAVKVEPEPEALAHCLARSLDDAGLADAGRRGRALVEERFSWRSVAQRHAAVYGWLAAGGPLPEDVRTV